MEGRKGRKGRKGREGMKEGEREDEKGGEHQQRGTGGIMSPVGTKRNDPTQAC